MKLAKRWIATGGFVIVAALVWRWIAARDRATPGGLVEVRQGPLEVWALYEGVLDARKMEAIAPRTRGAVIIEEIVPEGASVKEGDVLVRFDTGEVERDIVRLERDYAAAVSEIESLQNAKIPLEVRDLESRLLDAKLHCQAEEQYWADLQTLLADGLVSTQEVRQQEARVESARKQVDNLELQLELTRKYLHPLTLEKARSAVESLRQELDMARERISNCVIRAPTAGLVAYRPISVGGEFRNVRVGDTLYRNQTFMVIPKMDDPIAQINVPEAELSRVRVGCRAVVTPLAYPDLRLDGTVESVGTMAQSTPGRPLWHKFFRVTIGLKGGDERLRSGMSARVKVLTYSTNVAILIPRIAVQWEGETPWCWVWHKGHRERRDLELGAANDSEVAVRRGVSAGDKVLVP